MRKLFCMALACFLIFVMSGCARTQEPIHEQPASVEPIADDESSEVPISGDLAGSVESVSSQAESADSDHREEPEGSEISVESSYSFDFETKTVMLNSGYEMPIYGLGTYSLTGRSVLSL